MSSTHTTEAPIYRRITSIKLNNYRAYYGEYAPIKLDKGQSLLIYGENGSGKSSLFKALNNYFTSSVDVSQPFVKNRYKQEEDGVISLGFTDFNANDHTVLGGTYEEFHFGSASANNNVPFIQNSALIKGFLDYSDLLNVYFHTDPSPNLFNLIVNKLLGDHIPIRSGGNFKFGQKWDQLQNDLIFKPYTRKDRCHQNAIAELPKYQAHLKSTLTDIFAELNNLLSKYFPDLCIELNYRLADIQFNYGLKRNWNTVANLKLLVKKDGLLVRGSYRDFLNEARLSAFAICLYLASLKRNPSQLPLKVLYLDDVFIGLDAGNRIPILNILLNEFKDYQIFISTYDRHWYELSKRHFELNVPSGWLTYEFYVGQESVNGQSFSKPIIVAGESSYDKAVSFLHNRSKPDYPAAANYFRKALEELIQTYVPKWEIADAERTQIPDYQLTSLSYRTKDFLERTGNDSSDITCIIGLLHSLLHPLSHYDISSQIYKGELIIIEASISKLEKMLRRMEIPSNYRCCLESGKKLKVNIIVDMATSHHYFYELILKNSLVIKKADDGLPLVSKAHCVADRCYGQNSSQQYPSKNLNRKQPQFNYDSLLTAYERIHSFLSYSLSINIPIVSNYLEAFEYHDGSSWQPLNNLIVWE